MSAIGPGISRQIGRRGPRRSFGSWASHRTTSLVTKFSEMVVSSGQGPGGAMGKGLPSEKQGSLIEYRVVRPSGEVRTVVCTVRSAAG